MGDKAVLSLDVPPSDGDAVSGDAVLQHAALKPCPCCGYRAEIEQIPYEPEGPNSGGYYIECKRAGCGITTRLAFACKDDPIPTLLDAWNRRSVTTTTVAKTNKDLCPTKEKVERETIERCAKVADAEAERYGQQGDDWLNSACKGSTRIIAKAIRALQSSGDKT